MLVEVKGDIDDNFGYKWREGANTGDIAMHWPMLEHLKTNCFALAGAHR